MIVLLATVPALAGSPGRYDDHNQGVYLPYANAPGPGEDITALPRLRISFGGRSYGAVMDTGSTGVVVSADKIPNLASLLARSGRAHLFQLRPHHDWSMGRHADDHHGR
jgi:hypothetical protein